MVSSCLRRALLASPDRPVVNGSSGVAIWSCTGPSVTARAAWRSSSRPGRLAQLLGITLALGILIGPERCCRTCFVADAVASITRPRGANPWRRWSSTRVSMPRIRQRGSRADCVRLAAPSRPAAEWIAQRTPWSLLLRTLIRAHAECRCDAIGWGHGWDGGTWFGASLE